MQPQKTPPMPFHQPDNLYSLKTEMTDGRISSGAISMVELTRLNEMKDVVDVASGALRYEGSLVHPPEPELWG